MLSGLQYFAKKLTTIPLIFAVLLVMLIVAGIAGVLMMRSSRAHTSHTSILAAGPAATMTKVATDTTTLTPSLAATTTLTPATIASSNANIRVTQNQSMQPLCINNPEPYTVVLLNAGKVTATWHVAIPRFASGSVFKGNESISSTIGPHPLAKMYPNSGAPAWATANPSDGSIAPGQTASFIMTPLTAMPCGGASYQASVQLKFPSGASQPDIPLSYTGMGPVAQSNVVLVSGSLNITQVCPTNGATPPPFTFAIKNMGNGIAYPSVDNSKDAIGANPWADFSITYDPPNPAVTTWLYPNETWTVTIAPSSKVQCGGTYHIYAYINNTQGVSSTMTFTDTFN
jgi:hypothetical protein